MKSIKHKIILVFLSSLISLTAYGDIVEYQRYINDPDNPGNVILDFYYYDTETSQPVDYEVYKQWQASESLKNEIKVPEPNFDDIKLPEIVFEDEGSSSSASGGSSSSSGAEIVVTASETSWWDNVIDSVADAWNSFSNWLEQQFNYWWAVLWG